MILFSSSSDSAPIFGSMAGGNKNHRHDHHHRGFHLPHLGHHHHHDGSAGEKEAPPKGCMAIKVGGDGEEQQRFVVPVEYLNHPLFAGFLKEAEEAYGLRQAGAITIPCHVDEFQYVRGIIDREHQHQQQQQHHHHHHHHHQLPLVGCFKA